MQATGEIARSSAFASKPFLESARLFVVRILVWNYMLTLSLLFLGNIPAFGTLLMRIQEANILLRLIFGLMGSFAGLTFFFLFGLCLYHFSRGYVGSKPRTAWLWVILLFSFVGIVLYWFLVIERERKVELSGGLST